MTRLDYATAKAAEGQVFSIALPEGGTGELLLERVVQRQPHKSFTVDGDTFSMVFVSSGDRLHESNTHRLRNDVTGERDIFLSPISFDPQANVYRYEAIFT